MTAQGEVARIVDVDPRYLDLIVQLPLAPIRSEEQYESAISVLDRLVDHENLSAAEEDYRDVLVDLVGDWEDENVHLPEVSGRAILRHLMEEQDLKQKDLVPVFGSKSIVSEVLSRKRQFTLAQVRKLAEYFQVSPALFVTGDDANVVEVR